MLFPSLVVDNFFEEPKKIIDFSKKLSFKYDGVSPGIRSKLIHEIDYTFYNWINNKILSLLYPNDIESVTYTANAQFQKISPNLKYVNWIHADTSAQITAIIYLSEDSDVGTSLFKNIGFKDSLNQQIKYTYFENPNIKDEKYLNQLENEYKINQSNFKESLKVNGIYNRLFLFDSWNYHGAHKFISSKKDSERLTYIVFFNDIYSKNKQLQYPIPTMRRMTY